MARFIIRTHTPRTDHQAPHIFILNKGMNSGKPLTTPCPNSFVILFNTYTDREEYYWLAYSLWQAKFWHPHLTGSVIPFLRLPEFRKEFIKQTTHMLQNTEKHEKSIESLRLLKDAEERFRYNIRLVEDLRRMILYRYIRK